MLRRLTALLTALLCLTGGAFAELRFLTATDLHYLSPALNDHGPAFEALMAASDAKLTARCEEITEGFVAAAAAEAPAFVVLTGDLTFNGARQSHLDLAAKLRRLTEGGIPVFVLPGNHDLNSASAVSFEGENYWRAENVSAADFAAIYGFAGYEAALSRDEASLSYLAEPVPGLRLLMIDVNGCAHPGMIAQATIDWATDCLRQAQADGARVLAFSHQNLSQHSVFDGGYVFLGGPALEYVYAKYGVAANFSGHMHIQHISEGRFGVPDFAGSSLAVSPLQYARVTLTADRLDYRTVPTPVQAEGIGDFSAYAADFFNAHSLHIGQKRTEGRADAQALLAFFLEVNAAYFSGRMDTIDPDEPRAAAWKAIEGYDGQYMRVMLAEAGTDHTARSIPLSPLPEGGAADEAQ